MTAGDKSGSSGDASSQADENRSSARTYLLLSTLLLVALGVQLNYVSFRHYDRWDWTQHSIYTLSERTEAVLAELDDPVEIWILLSEAEPGFGELRNLLGRYDAASDQLEIHYVDPDRDPGAYREVAQRFELGAMIVGDAQLSDVAAVIRAGERQWEVTRDDLVSQSADPFAEDNQVRLNVEGERAITGALVELTTGRPTKVCVVRGHGEFSVSGSGRSLAGFAAEMRRENLELEEIETRGQTRIPEDCDGVAVVGPELPYEAAEVELLARYLRGGGNLFLALDPVPNPDQTAFINLGFEGMLRGHGIRLDRTVVVEPNPALLPAGVGHRLGPYAVVGWGEHEINAPFRASGLPLLVSEVRSVRPIDENRVTVLLSASEQSFAVSDLATLPDVASGEGPGNAEIVGPVPVAVATRVEVLDGADDIDAEDHEDEGADEERGGRLVVIGDATMFASEFLQEPTVVNRNFASAAIGWLTSRSALISIEARTIESQPISMSEEDVANLFLRVVVLIPLAFVFLGFAVWWNRRA